MVAETPPLLSWSVAAGTCRDAFDLREKGSHPLLQAVAARDADECKAACAATTTCASAAWLKQGRTTFQGVESQCWLSTWCKVPNCCHAGFVTHVKPSLNPIVARPAVVDEIAAFRRSDNWTSWTSRAALEAAAVPTMCPCEATLSKLGKRAKCRRGEPSMPGRFGCECTSGSDRQVWVTSGCDAYFKCTGNSLEVVRCSAVHFSTRGTPIVTRCACPSQLFAMGAAPFVIAFPGRFERPAAILHEVGFPPARHLLPLAAPEPVPVVAAAASDASASSSTSCTFSRGVRSLSATHAAAWRAIVAQNLTAAIFEDDIGYLSLRSARVRLVRTLRHNRAADLLLLGSCARWKLCTHAYVATPAAAAALLNAYSSRPGGCIEVRGLGLPRLVSAMPCLVVPRLALPCLALPCLALPCLGSPSLI